MLLKHSLPISQSNFSPLLPLPELLQIRTPGLRLTSAIELLLCSIVGVTHTFDAGFAVVIAAAEGSDSALTAAEAGRLAGWGAEVVGLLRVDLAFNVLDT
jgi:hypothetical protein